MSSCQSKAGISCGQSKGSTCQDKLEPPSQNMSDAGASSFEFKPGSSSQSNPGAALQGKSDDGSCRSGHGAASCQDKTGSSSFIRSLPGPSSRNKAGESSCQSNPGASACQGKSACQGEPACQGKSSCQAKISDLQKHHNGDAAQRQPIEASSCAQPSILKRQAPEMEQALERQEEQEQTQ